MEKSEIKKTSSLIFLNELKKFNEKLWLNRNTASIEFGAIIEEFEEDIKAETDYRDKCRHIALEKIRKNSEGYEEKIATLKSEQNDFLRQIKKFEDEAHQYKEKVAELQSEIYAKNEEFSKLKIGVAGEKEVLGEDYSLKVTKLYEELSQKNRTLLAKWVKKNENLKAEIVDMKGEYEEKLKALDEKEGKLEFDFNIQNEKLNSKIKIMMKEYEERVKDFEEREKKLKEKERLQVESEK